MKPIHLPNEKTHFPKLRKQKNNRSIIRDRKKDLEGVWWEWRIWAKKWV